MASHACAQRPPLTVDYTTQGRYETLGGLNTYIVGPDDATSAIVDIYDIFGFWPQTLQGADLLSSLTGALVLVPDFFKGTGARKEWLPPDTDEKKQAMASFFAEKADLAKNVAALIRVRKDLAVRYPAVDGHVGVFGLCWGGKIAVLASGAGNNEEEEKEGGRRLLFNVSGTAHPGRLDAKDGETLTVPHILLASKDEDQEQVAAYKALLTTGATTTTTTTTGSPVLGEVETYARMHHGWMGARANLADADNVAEFARGYEQAAAFFSKHL